MSFFRQARHYCMNRSTADGILSSAFLAEMVNDRNDETCEEHGVHHLVRVTATLQGGPDQVPAWLDLRPAASEAELVNILLLFRDANGRILAGTDLMDADDDDDLLGVDPTNAPGLIYERYQALALHAATWGASYPERGLELS